MSQAAQVYGAIPGVETFQPFKSREELSRAGVHAPLQAGIHGNPDPEGGAYSICLSQGYEDDKDNGDKIIYVGSGGQDKNGEQIAHQTFDDPRNKSLQVSSITRRPVRVVRGKNKHSHYAPASGYRYDGLYYVESARLDVGKKGFKMCFFELQRLIEPGSRPIPSRRLLNSQKLNRMLRQARK